MTKSKKQPAKHAKPDAMATVAHRKAHEPTPVAITVKMQPGGTIKLAVVLDDKSPAGRVLATLLLDEQGIDYRRPNQKKGTGRVLTWQTLDRLMQVGLC